MFVLDPINSITSVNFYKKVSTQSGGRTAAYLLYVALLFAAVASVAVKLRIGPAIDQTFDWLQKSVPEMSLAEGKLTSATPMPVVLRHPDYADMAVMIDTRRTDPVTPQMLEDAKVEAYVAGNAIYMMQSRGELRVIDLSKSTAERPMKIDSAFFESSRRILDRALYPVSFLMIFVVFILWKTAAAGFYSLVGMTINSSAAAHLSYGQILTLAVYAQTLVILLQAIFLFMPVGMPVPSLVSLVVTSVYLWLAVKRIQQQSAPPPAPAA